MQAGTTTNKLHPLLATAAIAVTAVSVLGAVVLVTNQVSAQHAAAPAAAVAAALPEQLAARPAPVSTPTAPATPHAAPAARTTSASRARALPPAATKPPLHLAEAAPPPYPAPMAQAPVCANCATVTSVREVKTPGEGSGIGVIAGGVLGGVIGNQFGRGNGKDASRILGAIGGAVAGHQIEKQARATLRYEVTVQMEDGSLRTLTRTGNPGLKAGDRVRIDGDEIRASDGAPLAAPPQYAPAPGNA